MNGTTTNNNNKSSSLSNQKMVEYPPGSHQYTLPKTLLLTRGFSRVQANEEILNETRSQIENNLKRNKETNSALHITDLSDYSFMLPDLTQYPAEFKEFLQHDLIEMSAFMSLSEAGHLNWWAINNWDGACRMLHPMVTSGDGNCLLHAASLAMWGLHDRYLILRKALHSTLENIKTNSPLWRRWKWEQMSQNRKLGLVYNDDEWSKEWSSLLKLSSYQPRASNNSNNCSNGSNATITNTLTKQSNSTSNIQQSSAINNNNNHQSAAPTTATTTTSSSSINLKNASSLTSTNSNSADSIQDGVYFESLEEFHVFVLAHIIQRPIIIVSDTVLHDANGEPLAPIPFGGIYLPLECDITKCYRYPLVLTYDAAHFSALVLMEDDTCIINDNEPPYPIIPITYANLDLLPIHFAYDPGSNFDWLLYQQQLTASTTNNCVDDNKHQSLYQQQQQQRQNSASSNQQILIKDIELTRDSKLYLLQNYLNLVKIHLVNSNSVAIVDIYADPKLSNSRLTPFSTLTQASKQQNEQKKYKNNKFKKFLSIFKRDHSSSNSSSSNTNTNNNNNSRVNNSIPVNKNKINYNEDSTVDSHGNGVSLKHYHDFNSLSLNNTNNNNYHNHNNNQLANDNSNFKHKKHLLKSWDALFNNLHPDTGILAARLSLEKPPKYDKIIENYIESAHNKFESFKHEQKLYLLQQQQQQQQQLLNNNNNSNNNNHVNGNHTNPNIQQQQQKQHNVNGNTLNNNNNNNGYKQCLYCRNVIDNPNIKNQICKNCINDLQNEGDTVN